MPFCVKCGGENAPNLKFCTACGTPISSPDASTRSELSKCSVCAAELTSGLKFCTKCGTAVASASTPTAATPITPPPPTAVPPPPPPPPVMAMAPPPPPPPPAFAPVPPPPVPFTTTSPQPIPAPGMLPPPVSGNSSAGRIVIVAVALLVLVVGGWFVYKRFAARQPQSANATPTAAPLAPASAVPEADVPVSTVPQPTTGAASGISGAKPSKRVREQRVVEAPKVAQAPQQQPEPMQHPIEAPPPVSPAAPRSSSGVMVWTGSLDKHTTVTINGRNASSGSLQGALPGFPVSIEIEPAGVGLAEAPSPSNAWSRIILRCRKGNFDKVTIHWHAL